MKNPIATTWLISFEQILRLDPLAAEYLSFMCCIDPRNIPQSLLPPAQSRKMETDAIGTLNAYSFVNRRPESNIIDLHRLVHLATRNWLQKESLLKLTLKVVTRLHEVFPNDDHQNRSLWRQYLPHARYVLESICIEDGAKETRGLLWRFGTCLLSDGIYKEAEKYLFREIEMTKKFLGQQHPDTLLSMGNLAITFYKQARLEKAEEFQFQVMEISKTVLGEQHPYTLSSMNNIALTLRDQKRSKEAEELGMQVMEITKTVLGENHPETLISMNNLAVVWKSQGRDHDALRLMKDCVLLRKKTLGTDHPDTVISLEWVKEWESESSAKTLGKPLIKKIKLLSTDFNTIRKYYNRLVKKW